MSDVKPIQSQSQEQEQVVTINLLNSGDPALERKILNGRFSIGRQLGAMAAVVEVLLAAREGTPEPAHTDRAIERFKGIQADIQREKHLRAPIRLIEQLEALPRGDAIESRHLCGALRTWLDAYESQLPGTPALALVEPLLAEPK